MTKASDRKTAVITGGNSGVGFETAKALKALGWRVVITGRNADKLRSACAILDAIPAGDADFRIGDFTSFAAVRALAADLQQEPRIDVLLNNIGIALSRRDVTRDGNDTVLQVNHLAPFLLTHLLIDTLKASAPARVINVSSRAHRLARDAGFDDFQFARSYATMTAYARTKLYNILFTRELARRLDGSGVAVFAVHPGAIATNIGMDGDMTGMIGILWRLVRTFMLPIEVASKVPLYAATSPALDGRSGSFIVTTLQVEDPSPIALDDGNAAKLWDITEAAVGLGTRGAAALPQVASFRK